jgi:hypothetical protein
MTASNLKRSWIDRLKARWGITSTFQVVIILVVFAGTGFSVLYAEELIFRLLGIGENKSWWIALLLFILITLPLYNLLLLIYGFILGQFKFFWNFEKRFFGKIFNILSRKSSGS